MKNARTKSARGRPKVVPGGIAVRIWFENPQEIELVKAAAMKRGLGFWAFVRLAALLAAEKVRAGPVEEILGVEDSAA